MRNYQTLTLIGSILGILMILVSAPGNSISAQEITREEGKADIILLSDRYLNEEYGGKIVGEVMNNGTETAEFVQASVSFYDQNQEIIGNEFSYTSPSTVDPGQRSPFTVFISSDSIITKQTAYYEIILQWRDTTDGSDQSRRYALPG